MALTERYARHYENPFYFRAIFDPFLQVSFEHGFFALKTPFYLRNPKIFEKVRKIFDRTSPMKRLSSRQVFYMIAQKETKTKESRQMIKLNIKMLKKNKFINPSEFIGGGVRFRQKRRFSGSRLVQ